MGAITYWLWNQLVETQWNFFFWSTLWINGSRFPQGSHSSNPSLRGNQYSFSQSLSSLSPMSGGKQKEETTCFKNQRCWETSIVCRPIIFLIRLTVFKEKEKIIPSQNTYLIIMTHLQKIFAFPPDPVTKLDKSTTETMPSCFLSFLNHSE